MKKLIAVLACSLCLGLASCQTLKGWFTSHEGAFKVAFADALRSLEGSPLTKDASLIPTAIQKLADNWLPKQGTYAKFVQQIVDFFVAAHPVTQADVDKELETLAVWIQTSPNP